MNSPRLRRFAAAVATAVLATGCADAPTAPKSVATTPASAAPLWWSNRPTYLACPVETTERSLGVIGSLGGLLSLGGNAVSFPQGAVPEPTAFVITVPRGDLMEVDVNAVGIWHYVFQTPVTVTIDYSRCPAAATEGKSLSVWWVSPLTKLPLQNMGGTNDPVNRRITFTTDHFSGYVIAY